MSLHLGLNQMAMTVIKKFSTDFVGKYSPTKPACL